MALDKVKQGVIADDAVGSSQIAPDTVVAADIGANAITASELADNAVDTAAIASNAVTTAKITDAHITTAKVANSAITSLKLGDVIDTVPHIIPGVLYPAYEADSTGAGKLMDGTTEHGTGTYGGSAVSTDYGTTQSDGRKYYFTNIAGSKPIKDPRIGGHFGSQRYKLKSLQLLEQETATHGKEVKCADGREWIRFVDGNWSWHVDYDGNGHYIAAYSDCTNNLFEITGYFNDINFLIITDPSRATNIDVSVNGTLMVDNSTTLGGVTTAANPLHSRFVDAGSMINGGSLTANGAGQSGTLASNLGTTPKINTVKFEITSGSSKTFYIQGIELIAQDTTSTANKSKIQIPSQNVVSYGKKFTVSAEGSSGHHYNPFNNQAIGDTTSHGKNTVGWTTYDSTLDTTTSLGLSAWVDSGNYYRPVNGGRVVKWVDSSGNIKTSVNMMPPSAKALGSHSGNSGPHETTWTTTYQPVLSSGAIDHTQAEVAKAFHFREFGNGSANGGTGATWADPSMLSGDNDAGTGGNQSDNIAYVMDDGLTSLSGQSLRIQNLSTFGGIRIDGNSQSMHFTFIGTGIKTIRQRDNSTTEEPVTWAQNLPYGTHILELQRDGSANQVAKIDGITLETNSTTDKYLIHGSPTFFQPKMPPIPEDACVLADYMLLSDFVAIGAIGVDKISKGVRLNSASRDFFADTSDSTLTMAQDLGGSFVTGFKLYTGSTNANALTARLSSFGTNFVVRGYNIEQRCDLYVGSTDSAQTDADGDGSYAYLNSNVTLGVNNFLHKNNASQNGVFSHYEIATPIHTSSHYQAFETPFLHELVGGDRNMEQHNLVCSPDGKTWDEITRDTSYIGNQSLFLSRDGGNVAVNAEYIWDYSRGNVASGKTYFTKDWIIGYDRIICLKDGQYSVDFVIFSSADANRITISVFYSGHASDAVFGAKSSEGSGEKTQAINRISKYFKRGDFLKFTVGGNTTYGGSANSINSALLQINKV